MNDTTNLNRANSELFIRETKARNGDPSTSIDKMRDYSATQKAEYMTRLASIVRTERSGMTVHQVADVIDAQDGPAIEAKYPDDIREGSRKRGYEHHKVYIELHRFKKIELYPLILWVKGASSQGKTLKAYEDATAEERQEALNAWEEYQADVIKH